MNHPIIPAEKPDFAQHSRDPFHDPYTHNRESLEQLVKDGSGEVELELTHNPDIDHELIIAASNAYSRGKYEVPQDFKHTEVLEDGSVISRAIGKLATRGVDDEVFSKTVIVESVGKGEDGVFKFLSLTAKVVPPTEK